MEDDPTTTGSIPTKDLKVDVEFAAPDRADLERTAMLKRLRQLIEGSADLA